MSLLECPADWIAEMILLAKSIKNNPSQYLGTLKGKSILLIFEKTSTRTRLSFERAIQLLGGSSVYMKQQDSNFTIADVKQEAICASLYTDLIVARLMKNSAFLELSASSRVPVINALDEKFHPMQALADVMTIKEKAGNKTPTVAYLGIANNVSNSLAVACAKTKINFILCCPEKDPSSYDYELIKFLRKSPYYHETKEISEATKHADFLYTDTWVNMEHFNSPEFKEEKIRRISLLMPYQINKVLLSQSMKRPFVMHCLPAHTGFEIDEETLYSKNSIVFDQAENRLFTAAAVLINLLT